MCARGGLWDRPAFGLVLTGAVSGMVFDKIFYKEKQNG
jgi:hypothetical protein